MIKFYYLCHPKIKAGFWCKCRGGGKKLVQQSGATFHLKSCNNVNMQ